MHMKTESYLLGCCGVAAAMVVAPRSARAEGWWIEAGPVWRVGMTVKADNPLSYAQTTGLLGLAAPGQPAAPGGIGNLTDYADRAYDNGYVKIDANTGSRVYPNDPNSTWNWGGGQYSSGSLSFFKKGVPGNTTAPSGLSDDLLGTGIQLAGGLPLAKWGKWSADLALGFQGTWGAEAKLDQSVSQVTVKDSFDVSAVAGFPMSGYQGTYLGPFDTPAVIPSPLIPNLPGSRAFSTAVDAVSLAVDQSLYQFSVGPQLGFAAAERLRFKLRPTISLNIMDVEVQRTESFLQNTWHERADKSQISLGLGAIAGADFDLGKGFYTGIFGGYEWVADQVKITVGPNHTAVDAGGFVAGAVIGKRF